MKNLLQKISFVCLALFAALTAQAGDNDLLWDYTETAPSSSPDNGLYYDQKVNDAAGTKNGLKGIKMNSSGYCYFKKAAVEGTLKLNYGPRNGSNNFALTVYYSDESGTKGNVIATLDETTEAPGSASVDLPSGATWIRIDRGSNSVEGVLCKIQFTEKVARTFTDFKINFLKDWANSTSIAQKTLYYVTATDADGVPTFSSTKPEDGKYLCTFMGKYHSTSYGITSTPEFTVPVDGTVKIYYGTNDYGADITVKNKAGEVVATGNSKGDKFSSDPKNLTSIVYSKGADTLTFTGGGYVPYFAVEACEVSEATITYKDQNGKVLGTKTVYEGDAIGEIPYTEKDLTIANGNAFRGWVYSTKVKVAATDVVSGNVTVSALVTSIESATLGSIQNYDLTQKNFYPEDHETMSITNGAYYNSHGWQINAGGVVSVDVAGKAQIVLTECQYGNGTTIKVTDKAGNVVAEDVAAKVDEDGKTVAVKYDGEATTLNFTFATAAYLHKVQVYNVSDFLTKDEASGYYIVPAGDAAALVLAFNEANATEGTKIFLPNGTYDFGETTGISLSGKNTSVIGESTTGVIIRNCPPIEKEGLGSADLLLNTGTGLYMQDLTLKNDLDYYKAGTGRAAVLHDKGNKTVIKNVNFRSYQDTYYSNKVGAYFYFETDTLQGTVDYLCGDGRVYYNKCTLYNAARSSGATMTANSELYVFNNCNVLCEDENTPYNFGRAWSDDNSGNGPNCIFLNTKLMDDGANLLSTRWNTGGINCDYGIAGEYGTMNAAGTDITPASNEVTFKKKNTKINTILTADALTTYSIENVLGDWAATAQAAAKQVTELPTEGTFLLEDGTITTAKPTTGKVRVANARGGFGPEIDAATGELTAINAVEATEVAKDGKYLVNGQIIIVKDGKSYNVAGMSMK